MYPASLMIDISYILCPVFNIMYHMCTVSWTCIDYASYSSCILDLFWLCIICILFPGLVLIVYHIYPVGEPVLIMFQMYPVSWTCIYYVSYVSCILNLYRLCMIRILYPWPVLIMYPVSWAYIDYVSCILYPEPVLIMYPVSCILDLYWLWIEYLILD